MREVYVEVYMMVFCHFLILTNHVGSVLGLNSNSLMVMDCATVRILKLMR